MFRRLGSLVVRGWPIILAFWAFLLVGLWFGSPTWEQVGKSGQFAYLPDDAPSRRADALYREAFPGQKPGSNIVLVISRANGPLTADDNRFVEEILAVRLKDALQPIGPEGVVARIRTPGEGLTGVLLRSQDRQAALVYVELTTEFLDMQNWSKVDVVEAAVSDLERDGSMPAGLEIALAGSAVLGRDNGRAEAESAKAIEGWTILVVVLLLLIVYRAPLLAAIPLITVVVAVEVALRLLGLLAEYAHLNLFQGVKTYVTVVGYGAGVDYCLFLIARCREEWANGKSASVGVGVAIGRVGAAIAASAATVMFGIAMMGVAEFGKLRQAGLGIAFALAVVLLAALTFTPALLCLTGRWALWPRHNPRPLEANAEIDGFWAWLGRQLERRPAGIWLGTVVLMAPFAVYAAAKFDLVSYDLTRSIPTDSASAKGLRSLRQHFPAGTTGTVTVLVRNDRVDFRTKEGSAMVAELSRRLGVRAKELNLADQRSLAEPLGTMPAARAKIPQTPFAADGVRTKAAEYYVGNGIPGGHVTRLELIPDEDPFTEAGLKHLDDLEAVVRAELPDALQDGTDVRLMGSAPGMRDLKTVTHRDQIRVDVAVVIGVFLVLVVLLRQPLLSFYLIVSVVFSYLTTIGVTLLVFAAFEPGPFPGLDWKVPFFLFTILVAVGEDYNIFLMTRVREEEKRHGPIVGVTAALSKTGGVITSCGIIMAGTFGSLFAGSLTELRQMGFALAFGVLLDTFVVRPVLVPAFLLFIRRWQS